MDESGAPSTRNPRLGARGAPHSGTTRQRDCGRTRRRPILLRKNHTSSENRNLWKIELYKETEEQRAPWCEPKNQRHSQLRSVTGTGVAVSPLRTICAGGESRHRHVSVQLCFSLSRLMEQSHWQPTPARRSRQARAALVAGKLFGQRPRLPLAGSPHSRAARCSVCTSRKLASLA